MNTFIKTLPLLTLLAFSYSVSAKAPAKALAQAAAQAPAQEDKKVDAKCFVELFGGGEQIIFWHIPSKKLPNLVSSIVGKKVPTNTSKQKVKIYKAYECVLQKDDFASSKAKALDAIAER